MSISGMGRSRNVYPKKMGLDAIMTGADASCRTITPHYA